MQNTQSCLLEIETLSHETSSDKRRQVLHRITDLFFMTSEQQTPRDIDAFGNVMERIAYELEIEARAELSERISNIDKAPKRLVRRLAIDDIAVAKPVLELSNVLTDHDLVEIAKNRGQTHLHAISKRPRLPAPVTDIIVQRGESPVLLEVTRNTGAEFSDTGLQTLAEKAHADDSLLTALGSRSDLPPDFMQEIKHRVSEKIKVEIGGEYTESDIADLDKLVDETAANLDLESVKESNEELQSLAEMNKLTEEDIAQLAKARRLTDTVHALSVLTGLDDRMMSHCFLKADIAALGVICKANGFESSTYLTLIQARIGKNGVAARDIARGMREYDALSISNAKRTLRFLKVRSNAEASNTPEPYLGNADLWRAHNRLTGQPQS